MKNKKIKKSFSVIVEGIIRNNVKKLFICIDIGISVDKARSNKKVFNTYIFGKNKMFDGYL